jgi:hypothetical protein
MFFPNNGFISHARHSSLSFLSGRFQPIKEFELKRNCRFPPGIDYITALRMPSEPSPKQTLQKCICTETFTLQQPQNPVGLLLTIDITPAQIVFTDAMCAHVERYEVGTHLAYQWYFEWYHFQVEKIPFSDCKRRTAVTIIWLVVPFRDKAAEERNTVSDTTQTKHQKKKKRSSC